MGKKIIYYCPYAVSCKLNKKCRVLTAAEVLRTEIAVWQQCPAEGKNPDGTKKEIQITIGKVA